MDVSDRADYSEVHFAARTLVEHLVYWENGTWKLRATEFVDFVSANVGLLRFVRILFGYLPFQVFDKIYNKYRWSVMKSDLPWKAILGDETVRNMNIKCNELALRRSRIQLFEKSTNSAQQQRTHVSATFTVTEWLAAMGIHHDIVKAIVDRGMTWEQLWNATPSAIRGILRDARVSVAEHDTSKLIDKLKSFHGGIVQSAHTPVNCFEKIGLENYTAVTALPRTDIIACCVDKPTIELIPVFDLATGNLNKEFVQRHLTSAERKHMHHFVDDHASLEPDDPSLVPTIDEFKQNFMGMSRLDICGDDDHLELGPKCMVMGGAVLACLKSVSRPLGRRYKDFTAILENHIAFTRDRPCQCILPHDTLVHVAGFLGRPHPMAYVDGCFAASDIDVFVQVSTPEEARRVLKHKAHRVSCADVYRNPVRGPDDDLEEWQNGLQSYFIRSATALTVCGVTGYNRNTQFITSLDSGNLHAWEPSEHPYDVTIADMLMDFDLDCCGFAFDGDQVWALPRARRAVNTRFNFVDPFVIRFQRNRGRLHKYSRRGFGISLYEHCVHEPRCDCTPSVELTGWWKLCTMNLEDVREKVEIEWGIRPDKRKHKNETRCKICNRAFTTDSHDSDTLGDLDVDDVHKTLTRQIVPGKTPNDPAVEWFDPTWLTPSFDDNASPSTSRMCRFCMRAYFSEKIIDRFHNTFYENRYAEYVQLLHRENAQDSAYGDDHRTSQGRNLLHQSPENVLVVGNGKRLADGVATIQGTESGFVYDSGVPSFASHVSIVLAFLERLENSESQAHDLRTSTMDFLPRFEHAHSPDELFKQELAAKRRPKIGQNPERVLSKCYMCGKNNPFGEFREKLCMGCRVINKSACLRTEDLHGMVALVTGARIKIGFGTALRLLRCGATVIATSRFPWTTVENFSKQHDFEDFRNRLHVYGLDLRSMSMLQAFLQHIKTKFRQMDIIVNNAAQTVRRPPAYYMDLVKHEHSLVLAGKNPPSEFSQQDADMKVEDQQTGGEPLAPGTTRPLDGSPTTTCGAASTELAQQDLSHASDLDLVVAMGLPRYVLSIIGNTGVSCTNYLQLVRAKFPGLPWCTLATQIPTSASDLNPLLAHAFPPGARDVDNEPLDLRPQTSWNSEVWSVNPIEMAEASMVNSTAPFTIVHGLADLMCQFGGNKHPVTNATRRRFVVNVSSQEGQMSTPEFTAPGSSHSKRAHPHTNMAKAALNMLTKSVAQSFAMYQTYVVSVDPGWLSNMQPLTVLELEREHSELVENLSPTPTVTGLRFPAVHLQPPLTMEEGVARVLDPVLKHVSVARSKPPPFGVLLKDFKQVPW